MIQDANMRPPDHPPPLDHPPGSESGLIPSGEPLLNGSHNDTLSRFRNIPDEVIFHVLYFLAAEELSQLGAVSRRFSVLCSSPKLWRRLVAIDFLGGLSVDLVNAFPMNPTRAPPGLRPRSSFSQTSWNLANVRNNRITPPPPPPSFFNSTAFEFRQQAKSNYIRRVLDVSQRRQDRERERQRREEVQKTFRRRQRFTRIMQLFSMRVVLVVFGCCTLATCAILTTTLALPPENRCYICVFVPSFIFLIWLGMSILLGVFLIVQRFSPTYFNLWKYDESPVAFWINDVCRRVRRRYTWATFIGIISYILLVLAILLLAIKCSTNIEGFPWMAVFAPLWMAFFLVLIGMFPGVFLDFHEIFDEFSATALGQYALLVVAIIFPLIGFFLILAAYLDGLINITLQLAFTPLWILDGIHMLLCFTQPMAARKTYSKELCFEGIAQLCAWSLIYSPFVIFQALLCVYANDPNSISPQAMFSPLFVWFSIFTLMTLPGLFENSVLSNLKSTEDHMLPGRAFGNLQPNLGGVDQPYVGRFPRDTNTGSPGRSLGSNRPFPTGNFPGWATSSNPQFEATWGEAFPDLGFELEGFAFDDNSNHLGLTEFQRMQIALNRALADMNRDDAIAIVSSAASAVQQQQSFRQQRLSHLSLDERVGDEVTRSEIIFDGSDSGGNDMGNEHDIESG